MYMIYAIPLFATVLLLLASISPAAQEAPSTGREADNVRIDAKKIDESPVVTLAEGLKVVTSESHVVKVARQDEAIAESDS
ncbi:MAG: hypothetical protein ABSC57_07270, partial [Syntrophales bacterium]